MFEFDVAVIGAGVAGLVWAQQLRFTRYKVMVEKSRSLGEELRPAACMVLVPIVARLI